MLKHDLPIRGFCHWSSVACICPKNFRQGPIKILKQTIGFAHPRHLGSAKQQPFPNSEASNKGAARRSEPPIWGRLKGFVPICSDLFRCFFFRFVPNCAPQLFSGIPLYLFRSDLLRFVPICSDLFSEQIRKTPFCRPFLQIPAKGTVKIFSAAGHTLLVCRLRHHNLGDSRAWRLASRSSLQRKKTSRLTITSTVTCWAEYRDLGVLSVLCGLHRWLTLFTQLQQKSHQKRWQHKLAQILRYIWRMVRSDDFI